MIQCLNLSAGGTTRTGASRTKTAGKKQTHVFATKSSGPLSAPTASHCCPIHKKTRAGLQLLSAGHGLPVAYAGNTPDSFGKEGRGEPDKKQHVSFWLYSPTHKTHAHRPTSAAGGAGKRLPSSLPRRSTARSAGARCLPWWLPPG